MVVVVVVVAWPKEEYPRKKKPGQKEMRPAVRAAPAPPAELQVSGKPSQLAWGAQAGWGD